MIKNLNSHTTLQHTSTTSFIGRTQELASLQNVVMNRDHRLITLTGAGGIGKTRLAIELAHLVIDDYLHGAAFVSLTPLATHDAIVPTIAAALNFRFQRDTQDYDYTDQLLNFLSEKHLLLILDNFEHLLDGADLVTAILDAAADIQIIVTSREPLNLSHEWLCEVRGMAYPSDTTPLDTSFDAIELFAERVRQIETDFSVEREYRSIVRICRLVHGMPLALEIAANWVHSLTCEDIAAQIQHGLDFLSQSHRNIPERHRSIRAVFDHSWKLLDGAERWTFERMAIFRGSFSLEAVIKIANASLPTLAALIGKSLVQKSPNGRYELHELVRQYAFEQLNESSQFYGVSDLHCTYYAAMIHQLTADLKGGHQAEALDRIALDFENIRAAWQWALDQRQWSVLDQMIEPLDLFCAMRSCFKEWAELADEAKEKLTPTGDESPHPTWARVVVRSFDPSCEELEQACTVANHHDLAFERANALRRLGRLNDDFDLREQGIAEFRQANLLYYLAQALDNAAFGYMMTNNVGQAEAYFLESLDIRTRIGDLIGQGYLLANLAVFFAHMRGDMHSFIHYSQRSYLLHKQMKDNHGAVMAGANFAGGLYKQGYLSQARQLLEELLDIANYLTYSDAKGRVLLYLSFLQEDTHYARELCEASIPFVAGHPILRYTTAYSLAWIELREGNSRVAVHHLTQFYRNYERVNALLTVIEGLLCFIARLLANEGCYTAAAELLGAAYHHYPIASGWIPTLHVGRQLLADVQGGLTPAQYEQAMAHGVQLDPLVEVEGYIRYFEAHTGDTISLRNLIGRRNQPLIEPLTRREREILGLVAQGLRNQQIAAELVVTEDTVKKHLSNVFGKLEVNTRTQLLIRAKELRLL